MSPSRSSSETTLRRPPREELDNPNTIQHLYNTLQHLYNTLQHLHSESCLSVPEQLKRSVEGVVSDNFVFCLCSPSVRVCLHDSSALSCSPFRIVGEGASRSTVAPWCIGARVAVTV